MRTNDAERPIGAANPDFTASFIGLVAGDSSRDLGGDLTFATPAVRSSSAGFYPVSPDGLSSGNYDITYLNGILEIVGAPDETGNNTSAARLPSNRTALPNPTDVVFVSTGTDGFTAASGGGPTLGTGVSGTTEAEAAEMLGFVQSASDELALAVDSCEEPDSGLNGYLACLSESLDLFAESLDSRVLDLPPALQNVSAVIKQATRSIEAARSTAARRIGSATSQGEIAAIEREAAQEARAAVSEAVTEIRKAIVLIKADEPQVARLQTQQGEVITAALETVEISLTKAVGL